MALREMDRKIKNFGINEINPLLNSKVDEKKILNTFNNINNELENRPTNDEIFQILNEKVDKKELIYYLNSKPSTNDLYNNRKKIEEIQKNLETFQNNIYKVIGVQEFKSSRVQEFNGFRYRHCYYAVTAVNRYGIESAPLELNTPFEPRQFNYLQK